MNDRRLTRIAADAVELLTRAELALASTLGRMTDALGAHPGAQALEGDRTWGHTTITDDRGVPMPSVSDPTGEAAIRPDPARRDRERLERAWLTVARQADEIVRLCAAYSPRRPTDADRRLLAGEEPEGCGSCARLRHWSPVHRRTNPATGERMALCTWCYGWARSTGRLPSDSELDAHLSGRKLRRPA